MKKLFPFLLILLVASVTVQAQTTEIKGKTKAKGAMPEQSMRMHDGLMMQGGNLMQVNNGVTTTLSENQTLSNGAVVMPDGTVSMPDGSSMKMHDGDQITMDGKLMHHHPNMESDGKANKSKGHNELGKTKMKTDDEADNMKKDKHGKSKLKATDEKMKLKNNQGESKTKYDE